MAQLFPTLYEMEPIGVDNALEAVAAWHFCSNACRDKYARIEGQQYAEGQEGMGVDGEYCEFCDKLLEEQS